MLGLKAFIDFFPQLNFENSVIFYARKEWLIFALPILRNVKHTMKLQERMQCAIWSKTILQNKSN